MRKLECRNTSPSFIVFMPGLTNTKMAVVRMSEVQYQILKTKVAVSKSKTLAGYIRERLFETPDFVEHMIKEIHDVIVKKKKSSDPPISD